MDLLIHTRHKGTVETLDFIRRTCSGEEKTVNSYGKVMAIVFWDSQGVSTLITSRKVKTITGLYYSDLLGRFIAELKKKRPRLAKKKV